MNKCQKKNKINKEGRRLMNVTPYGTATKDDRQVAQHDRNKQYSAQGKTRNMILTDKLSLFGGYYVLLDQ
jgi:hypothetical protein